MPSPREKLNWYKVGGWVRDFLRGAEPSDTDIVVIGHSEEEMLEAGFNRAVGECFPVFIHPETKEEWALGRTEVSTGDSHHDTKIKDVGENVSLKEDLTRRDLTVNAMAFDPETEEVIDPHGGKEDLENKILRHVSEDSFSEDPLRILRLAMFAARMSGFTVHEKTIELARESEDKLSTLDYKRIYRNLLKTLRKAENPRRYFDVLSEVNALKEIFPEIARLREVPAGPEHAHKEGSAFEHTMRVLNEVHSLEPNNVRVMLAAVGHDLGKGTTPESELPGHSGHSNRGIDVVEEWVNRTRMEKHENTMDSIRRDHKRIMKDAAKNHMRMHRFDEMNASTIIEFVDNHDGESELHLTMDEFMTLGIADSLGRVPSTIPDVSLISEKISTAERVIEEITGSDIIEQFDIDPAEEGSKIPNLMLQERVKRFRELDDG